MLAFASPLIWMSTLSVFGAYERRFLGTGSDEFRKVLNAGFSLTGALALISYAVNNELSRLYLVIAMQVIVVTDPWLSPAATPKPAWPYQVTEARRAPRSQGPRPCRE